MAFRAGGVGAISSEFRAEIAPFELIFELGEIAARGGDIRERLFGNEPGPTCL